MNGSTSLVPPSRIHDSDPRKRPGRTECARAFRISIESADLILPANGMSQTPLPDHFSRRRRAVSGLKIRIAR